MAEDVGFTTDSQGIVHAVGPVSIPSEDTATIASKPSTTVSVAPISTRTTTATVPAESDKIAGLTPFAWVMVAAGAGVLAYLIGQKD